jgi:hypothetical protein
MLRRFLLIVALTLPVHAGVRWEKWDDSLFSRAKGEHRFILLDRSCVVPLVPRDGRDDLSRSGGDGAARPSLHRGESRPRLAPRSRESIRRATPVSYRRIEWLDAREGDLPNNDVTFPRLNRAAAFSCSGRACSLPAFNVAELQKRIAIH